MNQKRSWWFPVITLNVFASILKAIGLIEHLQIHTIQLDYNLNNSWYTSLALLYEK